MKTILLIVYLCVPTLAQKSEEKSVVERIKEVDARLSASFNREDRDALFATPEGVEWLVSRLYDLERTAQRIRALMKQSPAEQTRALEKGDLPAYPGVVETALRDVASAKKSNNEADVAAALTRALESCERRTHDGENWYIENLSFSRNELALAALADFAKNGHLGHPGTGTFSLGPRSAAQQTLSIVLKKPGQPILGWEETLDWINANITRLSPLVKRFKEGGTASLPGSNAATTQPKVEPPPSSSSPASTKQATPTSNQIAAKPVQRSDWVYVIPAAILATVLAIWIRMRKHTRK